MTTWALCRLPWVHDMLPVLSARKAYIWTMRGRGWELEPRFSKLGHFGCVSRQACGVVVFHTQPLIPTTQWKVANPQLQVKLMEEWGPEVLCEPRLPSNLPRVPLRCCSPEITPFRVLYSCLLQRGAEWNRQSFASSFICLWRRDHAGQSHGKWPWHDPFSLECLA